MGIDSLGMKDRPKQSSMMAIKSLYIIWLLVILGLLSACDSNNSIDVNEKYLQAKTHLENKSYSKAIIELKNILQVQPNNSDARTLLGKSYLIIGDGVAAEKEFIKAKQAGLAQADITLNLVEALLQQRQYKFAHGVLLEEKELREVNTNTYDALMGAVYLGLSRVTEAEKLFDTVLKKDPKHYQANLGSIDARLMDGDYSSANTYVGNLLKTYPEDFQAITRQGELALAKKDYKSAVIAFEKALALKEAKVFTPRVFEVSSKAANAMLASGDTQKAIILIDKLISRLPEHPLPQYLRALAAYLEGDNTKAKDHLLGVLKVLPDHAPSLFLMGAVSYGGEDLEMAEMYLSKFVSASPSHVQGRKLLSATRVKLDQPDEAVDALLPILDENPRDTQLLLLMGTASLGSGDHEKGITFLQKATKESPNNMAIRNELAAAYIRSDQPEKAIVELEAIAKSGNTASDQMTSYQTRSLLVQAYLRNRTLDKALTLASQLVAENSDNPHAYTLLGHVKLAMGKLKEGKEQFRTALLKRSGYLPATMVLANILSRENKFQEAKELYLASYEDNPKYIGLLLSLGYINEKLGDADAGLDWLEKAREANKNALQPKLILARYFMRRDMMWKVHEYLAEAEEVAPEHIAVMQMKGVIKLRENSPDAAIKIFKNAVKRYPNRIEPYYLLSRAQLIAGNHKETRSALESAIAINPKFLPAYLLMASLEMQLGRFQQSETIVSKIRADFPSLASADNILGDLYMSHQQYEKAAAAYGAVPNKRQSLQIVVRQAEALFRSNQYQLGYDLLEDWLKDRPGDNQVRMALAAGYQGNKRYEEAIHHYEGMLKNKVEHPGVYNNLALAYSNVGDNRAVEYANKAHELAPKVGAITDTLGWILVQEGEIETGLEKLRLAVRQNPKNPEIRFHLAQALFKSGDKAAARRELGELLTSTVNFANEVEAQKLLDSM